MGRRLRFREYDGIVEHDGRLAMETWVFRLRLPRARRRYDCHACNEPIEAGQRHVMYVTVGVEGPGFKTWRIHGECYLAGISMFYGERPAERWCTGVEP